MFLPFCLSQPGDPEKITERSRIHILSSTDSSITFLVFQLPEGVDLCLPPAHHPSSYILRSRVILSLFQIVKRSSALAPWVAPLIHSRWEKTTDECTSNVTSSPPGRGELSLRGAEAPENHISTLIFTLRWRMDRRELAYRVSCSCSPSCFIMHPAYYFSPKLMN